VLVDSEPASHSIIRDSFAQFGLDLSLAQVEAQFTGGTMTEVFRRACAMGATLPDDWVEAIYQTIYADLKTGVALIPGVEDMLAVLDAAGIPYCVGSNGRMEKMDITLGQHPAIMDKLRGKIFSAQCYGTAKPEPELFLIAAKANGVAPARCVVIDDSCAGVIAARRAGMRCFGFAEHSDGAHLSAEGAHVFNNMSDLPNLLSL
jgi:HAD superfamily hydrolase (TIGR01509 family)